MVAVPGGKGNGIAFVVGAGLVFEIIAFACSSPQTAEINIRKREGTLMKWVHLGQALSLVSIIAAATIDPEHRTALLSGGVFAMASAEMFYVHARQAGLRNGVQEETEQY